MIRSFIIVANLLIAFLVKLLSGTPTAEVKAPASVTAGTPFLIEVTINPNGITDFLRYSMDLPEGWTAEKVETAGSSFLFEKNSSNDNMSAKFIWSQVGPATELKISYNVTPSADATGDITLACKLSHLVDNLPSNVSLDPLTVHIAGEGEPVVTTTRRSDSTAKPSARVKISRTVPTEQVTGEFIVDLIIDKDDLVSFGKLEDSLPDGFSAKVITKDGADFTFEKGVARFYWYVLPKKQTLHVQYAVIISPDVKGPQTIAGHFSYIENESGKIAPVAPSTVNVKENPAVIVQQTEPVVPTETPVKTQQEPVVTNQNPNNQNSNSQNSNNQSTNRQNSDSQPSNTQVTKNQNSDSQNSQNSNTQNPASRTTNTQPAISSGPVGSNPVSTSVSGVNFSVQIAAMSKMIPVTYFGTTFNIPETINMEQVDGLNKYTTGTFATYQDARNHRESLRGKGIAGPFVTAYNGGKRITVQEALMITSQKWVQ
jgi:hypothetical protein